MTAMFEVQDEITEKIVIALNAQFRVRSSKRQLVDVAAYNAFLRGRDHFQQGNYVEAIDSLNSAVDIDPGVADAWALLANINAYQTAGILYPNSGSNLEERRHYIDRALAIDPQHPIALGIRALMETF